MSDFIIIVLLCIIIAILISMAAPEILFWFAAIVCVIGVIVLGAILATQFIADPVGFISNLIFHNPLVEMQKMMFNSIMPPMMNMSQNATVPP